MPQKWQNQDQAERLIHILADVRIMQAQIDAIEYVLSRRMNSEETIDDEERIKVDALLVKIVTRVRTKAQCLYGAFRGLK